MHQVTSALGIIVFLLLCFALSVNRKAVSFRIIGWGMGLQFVGALLILGIPSLSIKGPLRGAFEVFNSAFNNLLGFSLKGSEFLFGPLVNQDQYGFIFAFQILPTVIFFSSLMSVLYYLNIMQKVIHFFSVIMSKTMGTSGPESFSAAANIFVGQTEAPIMIRPYLATMSESEIFAVMVAGMATIAGGVMAFVVGILQNSVPDIAGHLMMASVISAPAALVVAKILVPDDVNKDIKVVHEPNVMQDPQPHNVIDAVAVGATQGLQLALNIGAMLLVFIALLAMINSCLAFVDSQLSLSSSIAFLIPESLSGKPFSMELIFAWVFMPFALLMGIPFEDAAIAGVLLGEKIVLTEAVAYSHLINYIPILSERSTLILTYALSGFANFASIAIQIGGISALAPSTRPFLVKFGLKAVFAGSIAAFLTACIAGILL